MLSSINLEDQPHHHQQLIHSSLGTPSSFPDINGGPLVLHDRSLFTDDLFPAIETANSTVPAAFSTQPPPPDRADVIPPSKQKAAQEARRDRHSKIFTANGPRDRRVRLSIDISRKFFGLQDMLGFDKPSRTLDWLFAKSSAAICDLARRRASGDVPKSLSSTSECEPASEENNETDDTDDTGLPPDGPNGKRRSSDYQDDVVGDEEKRRRLSSSHRAAAAAASNRLPAKESRAKARARARARTREKICAKGMIELNRLPTVSGQRIHSQQSTRSNCSRRSGPHNQDNGIVRPGFESFDVGQRIVDDPTPGQHMNMIDRSLAMRRRSMLANNPPSLAFEFDHQENHIFPRYVDSGEVNRSSPNTAVNLGIMNRDAAIAYHHTFSGTADMNPPAAGTPHWRTTFL